ncbi:hypothetical protein RIF29_25217 [Crotalaria pallida]|uniref:Uncharacterized protein n=1 Tax=Crotalaria pallida TaxID=3830 RepID=A0AAN9EL63_CROPI
MGKKKGRPPRSPTFSSKASDDFSSLDQEDFDKLDNLTNKQAADLLRNLELIKTRLKGKNPIEPETSQIPETQIDETDGDRGTAAQKVMKKLDMLRQPFRALNKAKFANIDQREIELRKEVDSIQQSLDQNPHDLSLQNKERSTMLGA